MSKRYLCMTNIGGTLPQDLYKGSVVTAEKLGDQATINRLINLESIRETTEKEIVLIAPDHARSAAVDSLGLFRPPVLITPAFDQEEMKAQAEASELGFPPIPVNDVAASLLAGVQGVSNPAVGQPAAAEAQAPRVRGKPFQKKAKPEA